MDTSATTEPAIPPPRRPRFQFSLRTLLLLFVVLGSSLAVFGGWGIVVFGVVVGLAVYVHEAVSWVRFGVILASLLVMAGFLIPAIQDQVRPPHYPSCPNRLYELAWALRNYHEAFGCFPPAYIADKNGKPMISWRVLMLRQICSDALYNQFDLSQPWDSPKNKNLSAEYIRDFVCPNDPSSSTSGATQTNYFAVVGQNAAWAGEKPRKLEDFGKDASHTIMLVEATNSGIQWAEPKDLSLDTLGATGGNPPLLTLTSDHRPRKEFFFTNDYVPGIFVATADGSVRFLHIGNRSSDDLRKILQIGGFTEKERGFYGDFFDEVRHPNWPNIAALAVWLLSVCTLLVLAVRSRKARMATSG